MAVTDKGPMIIGVTMMFEVIALGALCLRFWSQQLLRRKIYAHDIFTLFGFVRRPPLTYTDIDVFYCIMGKLIIQPDLRNSSHGLPHLQCPVRRSRASRDRAPRNPREAHHLWKGDYLPTYLPTSERVKH